MSNIERVYLCTHPLHLSFRLYQTSVIQHLNCTIRIYWFVNLIYQDSLIQMSIIKVLVYLKNLRIPKYMVKLS